LAWCCSRDCFCARSGPASLARLLRLIGVQRWAWCI
jgi:hypothetical protein